MYLQELTLQNFRSFKKKSLIFSSKTTVIVGANTIGKTNILEAVYLLSTGKSFRAEEEKEIISYGEEITRVGGVILSESEGSLANASLEIMLTTGSVAGQIAPHKKYLVNGVPKHMVDFVGNLRAVLFWPEDMEMVTSSPSTRRKYLDLVLSQVDREYRRSLSSYEKGLRQRNKLLERIRDEGVSRSQLAFWDKLLIKNGGLITDKRAEFIEFVNNFHLLFPPVGASHLHFHLEYDKSVISESRLIQYSSEEVAAAATLVGPHRDDFQFQILPISKAFLRINTNTSITRDLSLYGSRGEQRLAILWLKLAELEFVKSKTGEWPILLLDDILSELDHEHREYVFKVIPHQQTIITTADLHLIDQKFLKSAKIIEL